MPGGRKADPTLEVIHAGHSRGRIARPTYYAHGPDLPRALDALQSLRRSSTALDQELNGQLVLSNMLGKWFNLKVAFDAPTVTATTYVNNCQKFVLRNSRPGDHVYYFKHGTYTCTSSVCRDHYKNVHTYQR